MHGPATVGLVALSAEGRNDWKCPWKGQVVAQRLVLRAGRGVSEDVSHFPSVIVPDRSAPGRPTALPTRGWRTLWQLSWPSPASWDVARTEAVCRAPRCPVDVPPAERLRGWVPGGGVLGGRALRGL